MMMDWEDVKRKHYGEAVVCRFSSGYIDFRPDGMKSVKHGENLSYDEYLDIQRDSAEHCRKYLAMAYFDGLLNVSCCGQIVKRDGKRNTVLFSRLMLEGLYPDGIDFYGKEDHIWIPAEGFESFAVNDSIHFFARVSRYMKTGHGRQIDFELIHPESIEKIDGYHTPTDEDLIDQQIDQLVCETCMFYDQCYFHNCLRNEAERQERIAFLKSLQPGKFTPFTVEAAYELEYRFIEQLKVPYLFGKGHPWYEANQKLYAYIALHPVICTGNPKEAFWKMVHPEKPRMYIGDEQVYMD